MVSDLEHLGVTIQQFYPSAAVEATKRSRFDTPGEAPSVQCPDRAVQHRGEGDPGGVRQEKQSRNAIQPPRQSNEAEDRGQQ
jgi:hypothetical protein